MKKTMLTATAVAMLTLGGFSIYALRTNTTVPQVLSSPTPKVEETHSGTSLDKVFALFPTKNLSFKTSIGPYVLENAQVLDLPSKEITRKVAEEFLENCVEARRNFEEDLRHSLESEKEKVIAGKTTQDAIVLVPLETYAAQMEKYLKDAYKKVFLQEDPYHFAIQRGEGNMFSFQGLELLTMILQAFDQVGVEVSTKVEKMQVVLPDQNPDRVITLGVPYVEFFGKSFMEVVVAPDRALAKSVHTLLPKAWVTDVPYLRMRNFFDPIPGAYTPSDKNNVICYNREGLYKQIRTLLDAPTNPFPFATLSMVEQEKLMARIAQMLFYHEQVHSMTKKVIGARPKDPACQDCEEKKAGIIEMLAFLVTFHHFTDVETRYVIMRIITQMSYGDYKLTHEKFVTPMVIAAVDKDPKKQCENGKAINVECVFTKQLLTDDVVEGAIKKAISYGEKELKKDFLPL